MNAAFAIFRYFPHGGLQLDFRRIVAECLRRGHRVTVYTRAWEGEAPAGVDVRLLPAPGRTNHGRARRFAGELAEAVKRERPDLLFGFNRLPGLDLYFAADNCFAAAAAAKPRLLRLVSGRYRVYGALERAVFDPAQSHARILTLTARQEADFRRWYGTPPERFHRLPPDIEPDRRRPDEATVHRLRREVRGEFGLPDDARLLIQVCSGFATKGVDRTLRAFAALPEGVRADSRLLIVGRERNPKFQRLAASLGIAGQTFFTGGRDDVGRLLGAADLMVHPARNEATGTVLAEALAAGIPVIASAACGYADLVAEAGGGVTGEPFRQAELDRLLGDWLAVPATLAGRADAVRRSGVAATFGGRAAAAVDQMEALTR